MATRIISEDLSYYIKVDTKKRRIQSDEQQPPYSPFTGTTTEIMTTTELAHAWLALENEVRVNTELLATMARMKRQLMFSIDTFVNELNLTCMLLPRLTSILMMYHLWSRDAHGMMPLISFLLPLVQTSNTTSSPDQPSSKLVRCFHDLKSTLATQDYLEAIITYLARPGTSLNKLAVQKWLDGLFEQYRLSLAHYSSRTSCGISLDLYLNYFDLLVDTRRLKCLSWKDRKHWIEKEWLSWTPLAENQNMDPLESWMLAKSDTLLNHAMTDLEVDLLLQRNIVWLSEYDNMNKMVPTSSTIFHSLIDWYTKEKLPNMRLIFGIFGNHCSMLVESGQDSTEIITILEEAQQLILQHLQSPTNIIALLMSMVQIALHHMESLLSYTQWFQSTFINTSTTCLKSKPQSQLWMKHMETMIPYETTTVLQVHAKALADNSGHLQSSNYISLVKTKLLALGVDATLRQYPVRLDSPLIPDMLQQSRGGDGDGGSLGIGSSKGARDGKNEIMELQQSDLQQLIDNYGEMESVPQSLWENAIFRPKWFKQTFLPRLMIEWKPTDPLTIARRDHMVKTFQRKGKVPSSLLTQYQQTQI